MDYTINAQISEAELAVLKSSGFNLCLTKSVNEDGNVYPGNVIFSSVLSTFLSPTNSFQWTEEYEVGMIRNFVVGAKVQVSTHQYPIVNGQTATFNEYGSAAVSGKPTVGVPFIVNNNWQNNGRAVVLSATVGDTGEPTFNPFYASEALPLPSESDLTPIVTAGVFFSADMSTGNMIDTTTTPVFEINFTELGTNTVTILYDNGTWTVTSP